ncbi:unnamed protein product [Mytilus coruscus]|uniref:Uncharacterized protein n=1 Tax=Mytilus coruscus TaxID=42192 RepID=A0A6J8AKA5_MYTCO|nr:unnamed protein product [Mytilus coruscus]
MVQSASLFCLFYQALSASLLLFVLSKAVIKWSVMDQYVVIQKKFLIITEGTYRWIYCCSCNVAQESLLLSIPDNLTGNIEKDLEEKCIHVAPAKIIIEGFQMEISPEAAYVKGSAFIQPSTKDRLINPMLYRISLQTTIKKDKADKSHFIQDQPSNNHQHRISLQTTINKGQADKSHFIQDSISLQTTINKGQADKSHFIQDQPSNNHQHRISLQTTINKDKADKSHFIQDQDQQRKADKSHFIQSQPSTKEG